MTLLLLHALARNGDGLHPDLVRLCEARLRIESDPAIVQFRSNGTGVQAGPPPWGAVGLFRPGNIVTVESFARTHRIIEEEGRRAARKD